MEVDSRFKQTNKEAKVTIALFVVNFLWWLVLGYGLAGVEGRILGFPTWFFFSCVLGYLVFVAASFVVVKYVFKDMSIEPYEEEQGGSV